MTPKPKSTPAAEVRLDDQNDTYEIGAEIGGSWVSFATVHGAQVRAIQANAAENAGDKPDAA